MIYFKDKTIHFIGIGGIGMSAIAESLHYMGIRVQGSNNIENANCDRLRQKGIPVFIGHTDFSHLDKVDAAIISSAIQPDNPELTEVRRRGIPVGHRAEMLAELLRYKKGIAVSGTHGKTTTTAMISEMLKMAGLDPSFIIGGIVNSQASNARQGKSEWMVVEADESDGSFLKLPKTVSVVTNIDPEHMDYYGSFDNMKNAYQFFMETTAFYGFVCSCSDHPVVKEIVSKIKTRRVLTYGFQEDARLQAIHVRVMPGQLLFDVRLGDTVYDGFELNMFGRHNILNALAALTIGLELNISIDVMRRALAEFGGVQRRFTKTGCSHGITVYDDYAHHPVEIEAVLKAAKEATPGHKVVALFQPHRYSRALDLADEFATCFKDADTVIVADIYAAGEKPLPTISKDILVQKIRAAGHPSVYALDSCQTLPSFVLDHVSNGDVVIGLGAGDISKWMHDLPRQLDKME